MHKMQYSQTQNKMEKVKPLTISELIEKLQKFPQDTIVLLDGCDCECEAGDVTEGYNNSVLILRTDHC